MNILTFDIEEWYLYNKERHFEFDRYLDAILNILDKRQLKATFFCVGEMGRLFPEVIRKIKSQGHEIGCHSNVHTWLNKMTESECLEDTRRAVESLEQCIGEKVRSYRAPAFSIGDSNKWAFEILTKNGIERDASVFPASRDFGGFSGFGSKEPCVIDYKGIQLKEFPICTINIFGNELAYSGGGYFRFFPLSFVKNRMIRANYTMCYFHIGDLVKEKGSLPSKEDYEVYYKEPGTLKNRCKRYIKSNIGKKKAFAKMKLLVNSEDFVSVCQADKAIDWSQAQIIIL